MSKKIEKNILESTIRSLKKLKVPRIKKVKKYSKNEALSELKPIILSLRERGFEYSQIVEAIISSSKGNITPTIKEISEIFKAADTPPEERN